MLPDCSNPAVVGAGCGLAGPRLRAPPPNSKEQAAEADAFEEAEARDVVDVDEEDAHDEGQKEDVQACAALRSQSRSVPSSEAVATTCCEVGHTDVCTDRKSVV